MKRCIRSIALRTVTVLCVIAVLTACASQPYRFESSGQPVIEQRAKQQELGAFRVRASVPGDDEAKALFGIPLHKNGIQAVWLEIENLGDKRARFAPYSLDKTYFPPHEVAYINKKRVSKQGLAELESRLLSVSIPRTIPPGQTVSGYVFTHASKGTKAFNVDIHYADGEGENEHFTFFITVPGFTPDHAEVDFQGLYTADQVQDLGPDDFRALLGDWVCCTTNSTGDAQGRPVNVVLIAEGLDVLQALLRAGWSETSYERSDIYLNNSDYYFDRVPDAVFRKGRQKGKEQLEIALWIAPARLEGKTVWMLQFRHAIGRFFDIGDYFFGKRLDPDVNQGRNYFMQDMWYSQSLLALAWSQSTKYVPEESPQIDFNNNAWFSDGYRLVLWLSGEPVALTVAKSRHWDKIDPHRKSP